MAIYLPAYCTREDVKTAADILQTADYNVHVDSAIQSATGDVNGLVHRRFYNVIETRYWDWPNYQMAYPWRIWLDEAELADTTVNVPVVTSGGVVIPAADIFWGPWNYSPPYTYLELNRATTATFGVGDTPQQDVSITGNFGYWTQTRAAGILAAAVSSTSASTITVTNGSLIGVGDTVIVDSESMLASDVAYSDTGQAQQGDGCSTGNAADNVLAVTTGSDYAAGELLQLDAEVMLATSVTGNNITVVRAYDGSVLATHSGAEVYAARQFTVLRGQFGTTAATHSGSAPVSALLVPPEVRELAIAEALNNVAQKTAAYATIVQRQSTLSVQSRAENAQPTMGGGLMDLRNRVLTAYGRKARLRVI